MYEKTNIYVKLCLSCNDDAKVDTFSVAGKSFQRNRRFFQRNPQHLLVFNYELHELHEFMLRSIRLIRKKFVLSGNNNSCNSFNSLSL